jgi:hypothetical protein
VEAWDVWVKQYGRDVFYLSKRVNGKPTKFYVGAGPEAQALAAELERRKRERREAAEALAAWQAGVEAAEGPLEGSAPRWNCSPRRPCWRRAATPQA